MKYIEQNWISCPGNVALTKIISLGKEHNGIWDANNLKNTSKPNQHFMLLRLHKHMTHLV